MDRDEGGRAGESDLIATLFSEKPSVRPMCANCFGVKRGNGSDSSTSRAPMVMAGYFLIL